MPGSALRFPPEAIPMGGAAKGRNQMGEIVAFRPHADSNEIEKPRWKVKQLGGDQWIVADSCCPGDFYGFFKTRSAAEIEGRRRNAQGPMIINDDDIPF